MEYVVAFYSLVMSVIMAIHPTYAAALLGALVGIVLTLYMVYVAMYLQPKDE